MAASKQGPVSEFLRHHFTHFNAGTLVRAADAWIKLHKQGGGMMVTLAGAMSTGELGKSLAQLIRAGYVDAITCTGANLEEDLFNLIGQNEYEPIPRYRDLTPRDEQKLKERGMSRVTDTAIDDDAVMKPISKRMVKIAQRLEKEGESYFPHEFLYEILESGELDDEFQIPVENSWLVAAYEANLPIICPGWEDSTLGNAFAAAVLKGELKSAAPVKSGIEAMMYLAAWYADVSPEKPIGFFQIGGGIAGDMPICVVPVLQQELGREDLPIWAYFCQITDAHESYGGYSGASPTEKITWGKIDEKTPNFDIHSDASIVAPLIFALVLGL